MKKKDILKIEKYYNKAFNYRQFEIFDFDDTLMYGVDYIEFSAIIITNKLITVPNFIISAVLDIKNKAINFTIPITEVGNILNN